MKHESIKYSKQVGCCLTSGLWLAATAAVYCFTAASAQAADAAAGCDRACLEKFVGSYVAAMVKHDPSGLPLAPNFKAVENARVIQLGDGVWKTVKGVKSQPQYVADVQAQQIGYIGVLDDDGKPAFFGLRLKIDNNRIAEAESIVAHSGESGPGFAPEGFIYREAPYIRDIPKPYRNTRDELLKIANLYWDVATSTHNGDAVPYSLDCWHFENGLNTNWEWLLPAQALTGPESRVQADGRIFTCARELYMTTAPWAKARERQFVVDEERGLVLNIVLVDITKPLFPPMDDTPAPAVPSDPIKGPGSDPREPLGMSVAGMRASAKSPFTMAHFEVMRIVDGKITREQDVMRQLPTGAKRSF